MTIPVTFPSLESFDKAIECFWRDNFKEYSPLAVDFNFKYSSVLNTFSFLFQVTSAILPDDCDSRELTDDIILNFMHTQADFIEKSFDLKAENIIITEVGNGSFLNFPTKNIRLVYEVPKAKYEIIALTLKLQNYMNPKPEIGAMFKNCTSLTSVDFSSLLKTIK